MRHNTLVAIFQRRRNKFSCFDEIFTISTIFFSDLRFREVSNVFCWRRHWSTEYISLEDNFLVFATGRVFLVSFYHWSSRTFSPRTIGLFFFMYNLLRHSSLSELSSELPISEKDAVINRQSSVKTRSYKNNSSNNIITKTQCENFYYLMSLQLYNFTSTSK